MKKDKKYRVMSIKEKAIRKFFINYFLLTTKY